MINERRGALRGTPGSACPEPEQNATELPSSAPGRPTLVELQTTKGDKSMFLAGKLNPHFVTKHKKLSGFGFLSSSRAQRDISR